MPNANLSIASGNLVGVIIVGGTSIDFTGGAWMYTEKKPMKMLLIAPNAAVSLGMTGNFAGTIISDYFELKGNANLKFGTIDTSGFLSDNSSDEGTDNPITEMPIIEKSK